MVAAYEVSLIQGLTSGMERLLLHTTKLRSCLLKRYA